MAFQEAIVTTAYDQARDLLGDGYAFAHQITREPDGQGISIASRWPIVDAHELDLHVTPRTSDFACATLIVEVRTPESVCPLFFVNHLPSWQPSFEYEREFQAVAVARQIEFLANRQDQHVILAGDFDAAPDAASIRFWSGRQSLGGMSVCYRDAWESTHPGEPGETFVPSNPLISDWDWPFRRIDYVLVRCGDHGGPTMAIDHCARIFDEPINAVWASDHFGLVADLTVPERRPKR